MKPTDIKQKKIVITINKTFKLMKCKFMHNSYLNPALVILPFENDLLVLVFRLNLQFQICPIGKTNLICNRLYTNYGGVFGYKS